MIIERVAEALVRHGNNSPEFELSGRKLGTGPLLSKLKGATSFDIAGHGYNFILGSLPKFQLDFLLIRSTSEVTTSWDDWISGFAGDAHFVMAWVVGTECIFPCDRMECLILLIAWKLTHLAIPEDGVSEQDTWRRLEP